MDAIYDTFQSITNLNPVLMKKTFLSFTTGFLFLGAVAFTSCQSAESNSDADAATTESEFTETTTSKEMLRHVVLFKFKDSATPEQVKEVEDAFMALPSKIKEIQSIEWGLNNSPENLNQGFTHCYFLTFDSEEDRAVYLPHPDHKAFGATLGPHLDKVLVIDYWAKQ